MLHEYMIPGRPPKTSNVNIIGQKDGIGSDKKYAIQIDEASGSITYIGKAVIGSSTADAVWQIQRIDESGDPELVMTWADGNDNFDNVWDNRASLSYS